MEHRSQEPIAGYKVVNLDLQIRMLSDLRILTEKDEPFLCLGRQAQIGRQSRGNVATAIHTRVAKGQFLTRVDQLLGKMRQILHMTHGRQLELAARRTRLILQHESVTKMLQDKPVLSIDLLVELAHQMG